jgi:hypothetical protein
MMPRSEIPVDILRIILEYVDKGDLVTICRLNKICCSCSQDVLYRDIYVKRLGTARVCQTLAESTHIARKVRSFNTGYDEKYLAPALQNMSSLRNLTLTVTLYLNVFEGCTFQLESFTCSIYYNEHLRKFLSTQSGLKSVTFDMEFGSEAFDTRCLPNLTRITAMFSWLPHLIPGRPVTEVVALGYILNGYSVDLSFFTLATSPIQKLTIDHSYLYPQPGHLLAQIFPSLTHLTIDACSVSSFLGSQGVCGLAFKYLFVIDVDFTSA